MCVFVESFRFFPEGGFLSDVVAWFNDFVGGTANVRIIYEVFPVSYFVFVIMHVYLGFLM